VESTARKTSTACRSAPEATVTALMIFAPVRRPASAQYAGPLVAVELQVGEAQRLGRLGDLVERASTKTPTSWAERRTRAVIAAASSHGARAEPGHRMKPERPGAVLDRELGVLERVMPQIFAWATA
jgi:hypothetical protein